MATKKYLDLSGLTQYDTKIKSVIPTKTSDLTNDSGFITDPKVVYITYGENILWSTINSYIQNGYDVICIYNNNAQSIYTGTFYLSLFYEKTSQTKPPLNIFRFGSFISDYEKNIIVTLTADYDNNDNEIYGTWKETEFDLQEELVSGTNIKTINNQSILGSGNISISGGLTIDDIYPVGSIYMSVNSTNPATLFGGTWQRIKDRFLLASGDTYANGTTGGSATHTLTIDEMPSHTHIQNAHNHKWLGRKATWGSSGGNNVLIDNTGSSYSAVSAVANNGIDETTATNQNTGGGQAHNNMPPYLAVYMWQRTA